MTMMFQCELVQDNKRAVAWIEERGARFGAKIEVPELGGLWAVIAVYRPGIDKKDLTELRATKRKGFNSIVR
jgi:hypothetical protein